MVPVTARRRNFRYAPRPMAKGSETGFSPPRVVPLRSVLEHPDLASIVEVRAGESGLDRVITHSRIQKSGLALVGHMRGIVPTRIQILGETEMSYLESLDAEARRARCEGLFALGLSCLVVTRGVDPLPEMVELAQRTESPLVVATLRSSQTINAIHRVLDRLLAPEATVHGVFVDVYGMGTLLLGPSGIGKSECALFLVQRSHRFVADDRVVLTRMPDDRIVARPEVLLRHHLEVRGLGVLNIRDLFGATAVRDEAVLDVVVELCPWRDDEEYDRLGLDDLRHDVLGVQVPKLRIPVRPGRDMAVILEVAARNQLLKRAGHHGGKAFAERLETALGVGAKGARK